MIKADGSWHLSESPMIHGAGGGLGNESVDLEAGDHFHHMWVLFSDLTYDPFRSTQGRIYVCGFLSCLPNSECTPRPPPRPHFSITHAASGTSYNYSPEGKPSYC